FPYTGHLVFHFEIKGFDDKGLHPFIHVVFFQSIFGSNAACQGYPRTSLSSPRFVMRNLMFFWCSPVCMGRSIYIWIVPALFWVLLIFHTIWGLSNFLVLIFICFRSLGLMKLSVAPESTKTCLSA